jgi:glycosyltransferase involved in cell wall biosynthesis
MVIAVVEAVRGVLIEDGIDEARVRVVPSGYDLVAARRAVPDDPRPRLGLPADARLAVNVAALEREKDHATLIGAAALLAPRVPRLHWLIAGSGSLRDAIERQAGAAGVGDRVRLLGHVADPQPLVAAADLFVLSSTSEGAGGAVFDALALGVPVVTTAAGGVPEIVGDAALVVPSGDPAALAEAAARVLADDGLRRTLAGRGRARIERFEFTRTAAEVIAVYRLVAGGR